MDVSDQLDLSVNQTNKPDLTTVSASRSPAQIWIPVRHVVNQSALNRDTLTRPYRDHSGNNAAFFGPSPVRPLIFGRRRS
jgi:hypothetical protein